MNAAELKRWLQRREDEHCAFKEARSNIDTGDLTNYCVALANEGIFSVDKVVVVERARQAAPRIVVLDVDQPRGYARSTAVTA